MKKFTRWLTALGLTAALVGCGAALAAEESAITVQLDGQSLVFTDATPQVRDQRTFLPFRAVFEAMGAEVKSEGSVITATRDGKTLTMTLNETAATLTEGEGITPITMDVAPYVDNATWRTYVPVRFAAQAFDCAVGWDQQTATAVIVDTDKVVEKALEGKSFTYLERLMEYSKRYDEGIWNTDMTMDGSVTALGANMPMKITATGVTADAAKLEMDMRMTMDVTQLLTLAQQIGGGAELSPEERAMLDALKEDGLGIGIRGDLETGKLYMTMSGKVLEDAGMPADTWFSMDMNAAMAQSGLDMDWGEYLATLRNVDYVALIKTVLSGTDVNSAETGYTGLRTVVETVVNTLSDEAFVKDGDTYTTTLELSEGANAAEVSFALTMKQDAVVGYAMGMSAAFTDEDSGTAMTMGLTMGIDEKDQMAGSLTMDMAPMMAMELNISGSYQKGSTAPATEPPAGATVIDLMDPEGVNKALGIMPLE